MYVWWLCGVVVVWCGGCVVWWLCGVVVVWCGGCVLDSGPKVPEFKPNSSNFPSDLPSASYLPHQST